MSDPESASTRISIDDVTQYVIAKEAEIERWKAQHEEFLLKHAREQSAAFELLDKALKEIERLNKVIAELRKAAE
jgi:hypothetical protein